MLDKDTLIIDNFRGKRIFDYDNSNFVSKIQRVPFNYAYDCSNIEFLKGGGFRTRRGSSVVYESTFAPTGAVTQFWQIKNLLGVEYDNRWLIMTWDGTSGRLYDTGATTPSTAILTIAGMKYAFVLNAFNRLYISPWSDWGTPLNATSGNGVIWVYTGAYVARKAASIRADLTWTVTNSATAGNVTPGNHLFGVVYETDTGFISGILPGSGKLLNCNGNKITVASVIAGPTGTIARWVIATKLIANYVVSDFNLYEPFFVYRIPDNGTTTATFDMVESGLVDSAAYLVDLKETIRAVVSMSLFNNRMIYYGLGATDPASTDPTAAHAILISPTALPETVSHDEGSIARLQIGQGYTGKVMNGAELRGVNYVFKEDSTFAIQEDPEADPAEWKVSLIDSGIGIYPLGIAGVTDNPGNLILDNLLTAGPTGIHRFNGTYDPMPISKGVIETKVGLSRFAKLLVDPARKLLFVAQEDPANPSIEGPILVGNYYDGLNDENMRWTFYTQAAITTFNGKISDITLRVSSSYPYPLLTFPYKDITIGNLFLHVGSEDPSTWNDFMVLGVGGIPPPWSYTTGNTESEKGDLLTFAYLRLRAFSRNVFGVIDPINLGYMALDSSSVTSIASISPGEAPGKFFTIQLNGIVSESIKIKLSGSGPAQIDKLILFASERGKNLPR